MSLQKALNRIINTYSKYEEQLEMADEELRKICDFNARITYCQGDGHLILNEETSDVATLNCIVGKSEKNKLTEEEHLKFCI